MAEVMIGEVELTLEVTSGQVDLQVEEVELDLNVSNPVTPT